MDGQRRSLHPRQVLSPSMEYRDNQWGIASGITQVNRQPPDFGLSRLIDLQLRSSWNTTQLQCIVLNPESGRLNIIVLVITDIVLLLTMFVGLLRFRSNGGGRFGVGRLIWKQVR
jgi:hypothetical protein